ncbi:MAG: hypothetical protein V4864_10600 [Pseudomonadota bacterium]
MAKQAAKKTDGGGGSPRWVIVLGALVGAGTLVWAVVSHFFPKAEAPKPAALVPAAAPALPAVAASVSVSGTQNFAAGIVNGGTITIGAPPPATGASR